MDPRILALLSNQHGLLTRQQALDCGLGADEVRRLVRSGAWVAVRRGVYALAEAWAELDTWLEQPRLRSLAAGMLMKGPFVFSHDSAADLLGLPILRASPDLVHVTRAGVTGARNRYGVKHHGAPYDVSHVVEAFGVPCLDLTRTAVDIAREHGFRHGLVACDGAMRLGVRRGDLRAMAQTMRHWTGVPAARRAIELADPGAESVGESLTREVVVGLGIGTPETQFEIRDEQRWVRCDIRVGRHLFEFDGYTKYGAAHDDGVRDPRATAWDEKRRQDWLHRHRLGVSRIVWAELWGVRLDALKRRLRAEAAQTERMWGSDISDLEHLRVARRPRAGRAGRAGRPLDPL